MGTKRKWASMFAAVVFLGAMAVLLFRCGGEVAERELAESAGMVTAAGDAVVPPPGSDAEPLAQNPPPRFTAHVLRFDGDTLTLVESREIEGQAKAPRLVERSGKLFFRIVDGSGKALWEAAVIDPRLVFYDSVDEEGALVGGRAVLPTVDFVLRVPPLEGAAALEVTDFTQPEAPVELGRFPL